MKRTKILYWVFTGLFSALMLFSAIPDIILSPETVAFMTMLGYPDYFTIFIGVAKVLGVIAILVPGFPRIKEWAYAGLVFDLVGATYSLAAIGTPIYQLWFMFIALGLAAASYIFYHKKLKLAKENIAL
ncbi:MAG TPA: DoxX family protein [Bacteroidia bacterium]|nr:DoxX family protein [Bacteroidia bacterium]